jgi:endonuclease/exonuclease/phosphatase family metal-dependent hydrolase
MKIVTYNIQYGLGADSAYDIGRVAEEIRTADIIALQEVDRFWERSGTMDQPAELARRLPQHYWVYGANFDVHAGHTDAEGNVVNRRRQFGTMLLSRTPILSSRNFMLPKYGAVTQHSIQQGCLEAVIETARGPVRFYSTHLSHLSSETRLPQVRFILDIHRRAFGEGGAWCGGHPYPDSGWLEGAAPPMPPWAVVMGDMNFDFRSPEYALFTGPMSPEYGRVNHREGFIDAWVAAGNKEDTGTSHPNNRYRIDHVFVSPELADSVRSCEIDTEAVGSDHWPVWVEMEI